MIEIIFVNIARAIVSTTQVDLNSVAVVPYCFVEGIQHMLFLMTGNV